MFKGGTAGILRTVGDTLPPATVGDTICLKVTGYWQPSGLTVCFLEADTELLRLVGPIVIISCDYDLQ